MDTLPRLTEWDWVRPELGAAGTTVWLDIPLATCVVTTAGVLTLDNTVAGGGVSA